MESVIIFPSVTTETGFWRGSCVDAVCKQLVINQFWMYEGCPDIGRMKESLSELLSSYPVLAGRVQGDGILCCGAGAVFETVACPDVETRDIRRWKIPGERFRATFDLKVVLAGRAPVLSVRASLLRNGMLLNVRCSHFCADGNSFYRAMEEWVSLSKGEKTGPGTGYDDSVLPGILAGSRIYKEMTGYSDEEAGKRLAREGAFRINYGAVFRMMWQKFLHIDRRLSAPVFIHEDEIGAVRMKVEESCGRKTGRNAVLSALTVDMLKGPEGWSGRKVSLVHTADHRGRVAGLSGTYMGNASFTLMPSVLPADIPVEEAAAFVEEDTGRLLSPDTEERYFGLYCAMVERKLPYLPFDLDAAWCRRPSTLIINNCLKFNIYGMDFCGISPVFAWPLDFGDPVRFWPAPPGMDGVFVYFTGRLAGAVKGILL